MERKIQISNHFPDPSMFREKSFQDRVITDEKFLHKLRLKLKEVRVLCDLLEFGFPSQFMPKSLFSCYRQFYRKSGQLRDINVQIDLFSRLSESYNISSSAFTDFILSKKESAEREVVSQLKIALPALPDIIDSGFAYTELKALRERLIVHRIETILNNCDTIFVIEKLHWLRKQFKKIIYLNRMKLFSKPVLKKGLVKRLHQIEVRLGNWHDFGVLREYIREYVVADKFQTEEGWLRLIDEAVKLEEVKMLKLVEDIEL
jgi:CHAD domain-containing protein